MQFVASKEKHIEVSLLRGLELLQEGKVSKLYSNGLDDYEFIYYNRNAGFYYEDNCLIGRTARTTYRRLVSLEWPRNYSFYVDKECIEIDGTITKKPELVASLEKAKEIVKNLPNCYNLKENEISAIQLLTK